MAKSSSIYAGFALLVALLPLRPCRAQTTGIPFINDLFVDVAGAGVLAGPPFGAPCGFAAAVVVPPTIGPLFLVSVTSAAPGFPVLLLMNVAPCPIVPTLCLPPVPLPIPPGLVCPSNQSYDLAAVPPPFTVPGTATPVPAGAVTFFPGFNPGFGGLVLSIQAAIVSPATPAGFVASNAVNLLLL